MSKNTIIAIGWLSDYHCYLNISEEEAIEKYIETHDINRQQFDENEHISIKTINFDDTFEAYEIYES